MLTVTQIAKRCGLSRGTLLYYESIGLLKPPGRTAGNYRKYGEKDLERLRLVCLYRSAGLALEDIRTLLDRPESDAAVVLKRRLGELSVEIERLRQHQRAIVKLLQTKWRTKMMTKEKWVEIMKAAGFTEKDMHRWHAEFEKTAPEDHVEFMRYLHIPDAEILQIREWSRKEATAR
jgi:MerR family transcriptional regulator, thiopeptide resistance regulator